MRIELLADWNPQQFMICNVLCTAGEKSRFNCGLKIISCCKFSVSLKLSFSFLALVIDRMFDFLNIKCV